MSIEFFKKPVHLALFAIILCYFIPYTPYMKAEDEYGEGSDKITNTTTITGWQMLVSDLTIKREGKDAKQATSDQIERAKEYLFGPKPNGAGDSWSPAYGILDKLSILVVVGALLLLFTNYQKANNEPTKINDEKLEIIKVIVIGLGLVILPRYCFNTFGNNQVIGGLGAWISLIAVIFLALEVRIMKLLSK